MRSKVMKDGAHPGPKNDPRVSKPKKITDSEHSPEFRPRSNSVATKRRALDDIVTPPPVPLDIPLIREPPVESLAATIPPSAAGKVFHLNSTTISLLTHAISQKFEVDLDPCHAAFVDAAVNDSSITLSHECDESLNAENATKVITDNFQSRTRSLENTAESICTKAKTCRTEIEHIHQEIDGLKKTPRPLAGKVLALCLWILGIMLMLLGILRLGVQWIFGLRRDHDDEDEDLDER
jgi:hypothetical protein